KFLEYVVFNEVMCKHPKWDLQLSRDTTRTRPECEEDNEESGGSSKRSRTSDYSNPETPNSVASTIERPIGRDAAKKKGKDKTITIGKGKFLEYVVFNEVMCKHPKWDLQLSRDTTRTHPECEEDNEESGGSSKRSRTTESGDYSNRETPNSVASTIERPIGRDAA
nr:hypothetical protein [Tanacetum cinerariifolium]